MSPYLPFPIINTLTSLQHLVFTLRFPLLAKTNACRHHADATIEAGAPLEFIFTLCMRHRYCKHISLNWSLLSGSPSTTTIITGISIDCEIYSK